MPVIVYSTKDPAGTNIAEQILETSSLEAIPVSSDLLHCEKEVADMDTDLIVFASKHKSEKGFPSFTVHTAGNWGAAEMGGVSNKLCTASPLAMKSIAIEIEKLMKKRSMPFIFSLESDHHGPLIDTPCLFAEVGSSEKEWNDKNAAAVVAEAIITAMKNGIEMKSDKIVFGIGGGHYCPAFTKLELGENIAIAHVLPKYQVEEIDFETFKQGIEKSTEKVDVIYIDWKGLNKEQRDKIIEFCKTAGMEWQKV
jgi:D-aminoacyl-tRNA deacylase